jgi:regulatory protein
MNPPDTEPVKARLTAMNLLARREHSATELTRKLRSKGYVGETVEQVIAQLQQENLLSDARFAENYVRYRRAKGFGPLRIQQELKERGVDEALIDANLEKDSEVWLQRAAEVREKRFGGKKPQDYKEKAKQLRFLQYRGFANEQLTQLFDAGCE